MDTRGMEASQKRPTEEMTEEDTFRQLKKPDLYQMMHLWSKFTAPMTAPDFIEKDYPHIRKTFFNDHNWTWEEFYKARVDYLVRLDGR